MQHITGGEVYNHSLCFALAWLWKKDSGRMETHKSEWHCMLHTPINQLQRQKLLSSCLLYSLVWCFCNDRPLQIKHDCHWVQPSESEIHENLLDQNSGQGLHILQVVLSDLSCSTNCHAAFDVCFFVFPYRNDPLRLCASSLNFKSKCPCGWELWTEKEIERETTGSGFKDHSVEGLPGD